MAVYNGLLLSVELMKLQRLIMSSALSNTHTRQKYGISLKDPITKLAKVQQYLHPSFFSLSLSWQPLYSLLQMRMCCTLLQLHLHLFFWQAILSKVTNKWSSKQFKHLAVRWADKDRSAEDLKSRKKSCIVCFTITKTQARRFESQIYSRQCSLADHRNIKFLWLPYKKASVSSNKPLE